MRCAAILIIGFVLMVLVGCGESAPNVEAGQFLIHLPEGDVAKGKVAFVDRGCNACHGVEGVELPEPVATPPVPVVLRAMDRPALSEGELVTAIIDPSHSLSVGYPKEFIESSGLSRMGDSNSHLTVQQLIDIVAFLKSRGPVGAR